MMVLSFDKLPTLLEQERTYLNTLELHLYVDVDVAIDGTTVTGDFTECTDGGYTPVVDVGFAAAFLNGSNQAETDAPTKTWVFDHDGGDFTVFGYYFTDPGDGDALVFAERAAFPFEGYKYNDFVIRYTIKDRLLSDKFFYEVVRAMFSDYEKRVNDPEFIFFTDQ